MNKFISLIFSKLCVIGGVVPLSVIVQSKIILSLITIFYPHYPIQNSGCLLVSEFKILGYTNFYEL
ncbi:MAG: hypothetical protein RLZZ540_354 [Bacteroidota bacterium]|jgi:hypothetical protein